MATWVNLMDIIYPVGTLYFSSSSTSPSSRFGGTWSALHASSANSARYLKLGPWGTGGSNTITVKQMPAHTHGTQFNKNVSSALYADDGNKFLGGYYDPEVPWPTTSTGGGQAFYPYYRSVYCWYRTA